MARGKFDPKKVIHSGKHVMDSRTSEMVEKYITQAEEELSETRVNFRWRKQQLNLVKKAAAFFGVPYQTYIKQVVYRQCLLDLQACCQNSILSSKNTEKSDKEKTQKKSNTK